MSKNDLLCVILKPTQIWDIEILTQRFGKWFCRWYQHQNKAKVHLFDQWYIDTKQECENIIEDDITQIWVIGGGRIPRKDYELEKLEKIHEAWHGHMLLSTADEFWSFGKLFKTYIKDAIYKDECYQGIRDELLAVTWHPDRVIDWCFDDDQKKDIERLHEKVETSRCRICKKDLPLDQFKIKINKRRNKCCIPCLAKPKPKKILKGYNVLGTSPW